MSLETFTALRNYAKRKITKDELLGNERLFSYMREDRSTPGQSVISIEFNNQHYSKPYKLELYGILTHKIYINLTN